MTSDPKKQTMIQLKPEIKENLVNPEETAKKAVVIRLSDT
jgi:hypothetical protein